MRVHHFPHLGAVQVPLSACAFGRASGTAPRRMLTSAPLDRSQGAAVSPRSKSAATVKGTPLGLLERILGLGLPGGNLSLLPAQCMRLVHLGLSWSLVEVQKFDCIKNAQQRGLHSLKPG